MSIKENSPAPRLTEERLELITGIYGRVMSVVMMLLGLQQWALIVGMLEGPFGSFDAMPPPWKLATMHFAVIDLVAAVGLWQRMAWGYVVWVYAALLQILLHTVFVDTFGQNLVIVGFHAVTVAVYLALFILEKRMEHH